MSPLKLVIILPLQQQIMFLIPTIFLKLCKINYRAINSQINLCFGKIRLYTFELHALDIPDLQKE